MKKIKLDAQQQEIKTKLDELGKLIASKKEKRFSFFKKEGPTPKSLYIFGDVGRGKSMLVKEFYSSVKCKKIYFHFNDFMENIHLNLKDIRSEKKYYSDELIEAVKRLVGDYKLLCFDEFHVSDIADAMLLSRIFHYIFSQKIITIFTSNFAPQLLYPDGLQREKFLEFVDLVLLKNCDILNLDSNIDYRKKYSLANETRFFLKEEKELFYTLIDDLKEQKELKAKNLKLWGRKITITKTFEADFKKVKDLFVSASKLENLNKNNKIFKKKIKIALFNFDEITNSNFASSDFRAIANEFDLIFLINLTKFGDCDINEAKRFVLFIDEIYEKKLAFLILSKVELKDIFDKYYTQSKNSRIFLRARSRINEIKSDAYFIASKIFN
ncbi:MAG: cell division protein ZapE [Rickettsiales bacterium]|nr:cell division protein ZapE [Rickettsiales bacterium]